MKREAKVGSRAPGFTLPAVEGSGASHPAISLEDYLDRWVMLLFYPRDFSMI